MCEKATIDEKTSATQEYAFRKDQSVPNQTAIYERHLVRDPGEEWNVANNWEGFSCSS